jgi:transposase
VQEERQKFAELMELIPPENFVFLDESGCNAAMTPTHGWSPLGVRCEDERPMNHGKNITMIGAIRQDGPVTLQTIVGAVNHQSFTIFIHKYLAPKLKFDDVVVMDNLRVHYCPEALKAIESTGAHVLFLPPYSPDLNPIEFFWSAMKVRLRRASERTVDALKHAVRSAWRSCAILNVSKLMSACGYPVT